MFIHVGSLGILIARHLKRLERVILGYLEVSDGPEEEARLGILETLQCTIEHAWPRYLSRHERCYRGYILHAVTLSEPKFLLLEEKALKSEGRICHREKSLALSR